jgi:hypothetical protein
MKRGNNALPDTMSDTAIKALIHTGRAIATKRDVIVRIEMDVISKP